MCRSLQGCDIRRVRGHGTGEGGVEGWALGREGNTLGL